MRLISRNEVLKRTSLSRATLWRMEGDGRFPKPVQISPNRVAYKEDDVDAWFDKVTSQNESA